MEEMAGFRRTGISSCRKGLGAEADHWTIPGNIY